MISPPTVIENPYRPLLRATQPRKTLPGPLVERFYAGRSSWADRARVLCGKPPVPIAGALRALTARGKPLMELAA